VDYGDFNYTVTITINAPTPDYIMIRDTAGGGGSEITTPQTFTLGETVTDDYYCAAYNYSVAGLYIGDWQADWAVVGGIGTVAPESGDSTTFTATTAGEGNVTATVGSLEVKMVDIEVIDTADTTPPAAPTGLAVTQEAVGGQLKLMWNAHPDPDDDLDGYNIYMSETNVTGSFNKVNTAPLSGTTFIHTGLNNGDDYYYRITAVDDSGNESPASGTAMNTCDLDTDGDNIFNIQDDDDDGDTLTDDEEAIMGTSPDTDGDTYNDNVDDYPLDGTRWKKEVEDEGISPALIALPIIIIIIVLLLLFLMLRKRKPEALPPEEAPPEEAPPEEEVPPEEGLEGEAPPEEELPPEEEMPPEEGVEEEVPPPEDEIPPPEEEGLPPEEEVPPSEEEYPPADEEMPPPDEELPPSEDEGFPPS
jgi:hypothetical protein